MTVGIVLSNLMVAVECQRKSYEESIQPSQAHDCSQAHDSNASL